MKFHISTTAYFNLFNMNFVSAEMRRSNLSRIPPPLARRTNSRIRIELPRLKNDKISAMVDWNQLVSRWREAILGFLHGYRSLGVMIAVALLSAVLCQNPFQKNVPTYNVGEIARKN